MKGDWLQGYVSRFQTGLWQFGFVRLLVDPRPTLIESEKWPSTTAR